MNITKRVFYDYLILYLLIATTAVPFFFDSQFFLLIGLFVSGLVFIGRGLKVERYYLAIFFLFFCFEIFQVLYYKVFVLETFSSIFVKLTFSYFVCVILNKNFINYYVTILKTICLISLFFYLITLIPGVYNFLAISIAPFFKAPFHKVNDFYAEHSTIIIYTLDSDLVHNFRNPGPFWEPGIFSIFILIALIFNTIRSSTLVNKTNFILSITLFSTISTTGILGFFLFLFAYYYMNSKSSYKLFHIIFVVAISVFLFYKLSFLSEKVEQNIEMSDFTGSRFGSFMADWKLIKERPFIGWGRGLMRFGEDRERFFSQDSHRNNGISALLTQYGFVFSIIYFSLCYFSFRKICKFYNSNSNFAFFCIVIVMFVGFSQTIFTRQFFLSFLFLSICYKKGFVKRIIEN